MYANPGPMALNLKNPETHRLAQELAEATGTTLTDAVTEALRQRLAARRKEDSFELLWVEVEGTRRFSTSGTVLPAGSPWPFAKPSSSRETASGPRTSWWRSTDSRPVPGAGPPIGPAGRPTALVMGAGRREPPIQMG
jgi:hypothetical protein